MSLNQFNGIGNLGRDAELKHVGNNTVLNFSIGINERYKDKNGEWKDSETVWIDVALWGAQAEKLAQLLNKGTPVFVSGKLKMEKWEDKNTGDARSKLSLTAFVVNLIKFPPKGENGSGGDERPKGRSDGRGGRDERPSRSGGREATPARRGRDEDDSYTDGL